VADCCEQSNEPSGFVKDGEFLDRLNISFLRRTLLHDVS
jgi:hypothetical protein